MTKMDKTQSQLGMMITFEIQNKAINNALDRSACGGVKKGPSLSFGTSSNSEKDNKGKSEKWKSESDNNLNSNKSEGMEKAK